LNILDGVNEVDRMIFLATTNYPERLGARIVNRPSRFDKRFRIGYPSPEARRLYLEHLFSVSSPEELGIDLSRWVKETEDFTIAHLKELFVAVVILEDNYKQAIETLRSMKEKIEDKDDGEEMGFMPKRN
jgi:SpoVK/Ycf46/Vps4 family AAA+-type ATPase